MIWTLIICMGCNQSIVIDDFWSEDLCLKAKAQLESYSKDKLGVAWDYPESNACIPILKHENKK